MATNDATSGRFVYGNITIPLWGSKIAPIIQGRAAKNRRVTEPRGGPAARSPSKSTSMHPLASDTCRSERRWRRPRSWSPTNASTDSKWAPRGYAGERDRAKILACGAHRSITPDPRRNRTGAAANEIAGAFVPAKMPRCGERRKFAHRVSARRSQAVSRIRRKEIASSRETSVSQIGHRSHIFAAGTARN